MSEPIDIEGIRARNGDRRLFANEAVRNSVEAAYEMEAVVDIDALLGEIGRLRQAAREDRILEFGFDPDEAED